MFFVNIPTTAGLNKIEFDRAITTVKEVMKTHYLLLREKLGDISEGQDKAEELSILKLN